MLVIIAGIRARSAAFAGLQSLTGRSLRAMILATIVSVAGLTGCAANPLPVGATAQAAPLHEIWVVFFWTGIGVAAIVYGLIAWCIVRYRKRAGDAAFPQQFRRNNRMEIVYTTLPILMVGGLFAVTYPAERHVERIAAVPQLVVNVTAFRWSWRFDYPQTGTSIVGTPGAPPELVLPLDETVRFNVTSVDVDHSFWVPAFLFKRDAIPGVENVFDWTPNRMGVFRGECGEFCGLDHALMSFSVKVITPAEFERWLKRPRPLAAADAKTAQ